MVLFGSRARCDHQEESDADVAVFALLGDVLLVAEELRSHAQDDGVAT
jgi:predicted nucleotidyltransferase